MRHRGGYPGQPWGSEEGEARREGKSFQKKLPEDTVYPWVSGSSFRYHLVCESPLPLTSALPPLPKGWP